MIGHISNRFAHATVLLGTGSMLFALGACGGAAESGMPNAKSPEKDMTTTAEPTSIEEAQQRIAAAKAELAGGPGTGAGSSFAPPPPAADAARPAEPASPSTSPVMPQATSPRKAPSAEKPSVLESSPTRTEDRCGGPCRALASMRRAVTALCRMTGNDDARCVEAKHTLADSEGRISPCSCR